MPSNKNDLTKSEIPFPSESDLLKLLQEVLGVLTHLSAKPIKDPEFHGEKLHLQRMVRFSGDIEGFLVLKCSKGFGSLLAKVILGRETSNFLAEDAVSELMNVYCGRIMSGFWDSKTVHFGAFLPRALFLDPSSERPPDLTLYLEVEKEPVQVLAWFKPAPKAAVDRVP